MMKLVPITGLLVIATGLSGCVQKYVKEFERPETPEKTEFRAAPADSPNVVEIIRPEWWQGFKDKKLNELIELAGNNNLDLANQLLDIERAGIVLKGAKIDPFLPLLQQNSIGLGASDTNGNSSTTAPVNFNWEFDFIGGLEKRKRNVKASYADYLRSEANSRSFLLTLISRVGNSYFQIRSLDDGLALIKEELVNLRKTISVDELRYREGLLTASALNQRKAQLSDLESRRISLQQQRDSEELELAVLLGMVPGEYRIATGPSLYTIKPIAIPSTTPAYVIENRPDVIAAEQRLLAAHEQVNLARLERLPSLKVSLSLTGNLRESMANLLTSIGANLSIVPFDSRKTRALQSRTVAQKQAANNYRQTILTAFKEVEQSLLLYESLQRQDALLQQKLEFLEKTLDTDNTRLNAGLVSRFEVIATENKVLAARQALYRNHRQILTTSIDIYKAFGGGWSTDVSS